MTCKNILHAARFRRTSTTIWQRTRSDLTAGDDSGYLRGVTAVWQTPERAVGDQAAMRARRKRSFFNRTVIFSATFLFACSFACSVASAKERVEGPGFVKELEATPRDVLDALKSDLEDQTIHGTLIFDKEPTLTGATQSDKPRDFLRRGPGQDKFSIRCDPRPSRRGISWTARTRAPSRCASS